MTMREYHLPDGTPVPAELQEIIADDVRAFDAAQTPEARSSVQLRKIANELPRLRQMFAGTGEEQTTARRKAVAAEIMALSEMGFTSDVIRRTPEAMALLRRYGLLSDQGNSYEDRL
jgi:hypothetical protein